MFDLSIIIPTKDRREIFQTTLESVCNATESIHVEIIIINDSKTSKITISDTYKNKIKIFDNPKSGVASARNYGASKAASDQFIFMDDDIIINKNNILSIIQFFKNNSNACLNLNWEYPKELLEEISKKQFGRYLISHGFTNLKGWNAGEIWNDKELFENNGVSSYLLPITRKQFESINGYNESFPHAGFEDYDFAVRLKKQGIKSFILPTEFVYHNERDRVELKNWLTRKKQNGRTRKVALENGYSNLKMYHSFSKKMAYTIIIKTKPLLVSFLSLIPNNLAFDFIYFKSINTLLGATLYEGYKSK